MPEPHDANLAKGRRFRIHVLLKLVLQTVVIGVVGPIINAAQFIEETHLPRVVAAEVTHNRFSPSAVTRFACQRI